MFHGCLYSSHYVPLIHCPNLSAGVNFTPLNCHAFGVILTIWSAISCSHAQGIESDASVQLLVKVCKSLHIFTVCITWSFSRDNCVWMRNGTGLRVLDKRIKRWLQLPRVPIVECEMKEAECFCQSVTNDKISGLFCLETIMWCQGCILRWTL